MLLTRRAEEKQYLADTSARRFDGLEYYFAHRRRSAQRMGSIADFSPPRSSAYAHGWRAWRVAMIDARASGPMNASFRVGPI